MILVYQQKEFLVFLLKAFLCGVILGGVYDVFRIIRIFMGMSSTCTDGVRWEAKRSLPLVGKLEKRGILNAKVANAVIVLEDILFMLIACVMTLSLLFFYNDGKFRLIAILSQLFGFTCYHVSVGRLVISCSSFVITVLRILAAYLIFFVRTPFLLICKTVYKGLRALKLAVLRWKIRQNILLCAGIYKDEIMRNACEGFLAEINSFEAKTSNARRKKNIGGIKNVKSKAKKKV